MVSIGPWSNFFVRNCFKHRDSVLIGLTSGSNQLTGQPGDRTKNTKTNKERKPTTVERLETSIDQQQWNEIRTIRWMACNTLKSQESQANQHSRVFTKQNMYMAKFIRL